MLQINFQSGQYMKLKPILPVLKGVKFEWHPDSKNHIAIFRGDALVATNVAFEEGLISKQQADFMYEILHPDNRVY